ncbi:MAG: LysM peptidoglycan-binding domain-containing protein [Anaerolineaceae bacterium]|nr:LysM peptidoglycan-binding domain-containing protein [Anaerolineaceae bacterium]
MKKSIYLIVVMLLLVITGTVLAQEMLIGGSSNALPQLQSGLPDPAVTLGTIGSLYQKDYAYYDTLYDTYLYPKPEQTQSFLEAYITAAANAGYTADTDMENGFSVLRITANGNPGTAALLFYDYQGYVLLMVPTSMGFSLNGENSGPVDAPYMVERGYEAIQNEDYEAAIRYLILAAGAYIRNANGSQDAMIVNTMVPTAQPSGPTTYTVQDGDTCWGIAVDRFGVNFELFMQVNGMVDCNIGIGDEVIIPGAEQQVATSTPIPLDQYSTGQVVSYIVEMNDSYNDIAAKFGTTLESIQRLNNVNVYTTFPQYGQVLQIEVNLVTPTPLPEVTATPIPATLQP